MTTVYPTQPPWTTPAQWDYHSTSSTWYPTITTSTTTLDPHAVRDLVVKQHCRLEELEHRIRQVESYNQFLRGAVEWLAENPGMTLADYEKYQQVRTTIGEAAKHGTEQMADAGR